jgi:hypothetical protein
VLIEVVLLRGHGDVAHVGLDYVTPEYRDLAFRRSRREFVLDR